MAEGINALILPIGADPTQFQKSINDVKNNIKELSSTISATPFNLVSAEQKANLAQLQNTLKTLTNDLKEFGKSAEPAANSIAGLDKKIKELNAQKITLDAKTSASEIARLNKEIEKLTKQRNNIDALGSSVQRIGQVGSDSFKKVQDSSKGARTALTSLSLVAQDAPFGFIAIQNNLPAVLASFGELSKGAAGLKGALSQVGSALVGPAGLFLAFSIVTGAITFAVQKYGSLGNAITAIVSDNEDLAKTIAKVRKEYDSYNNSLDNIDLSVKKSEASDAGKIETIKILTQTVTNLENSESKRSTALNNLKSIDKDYYGSFTTSAEDSEKLRKATDLLTESIIRQAKIKGLESRITAITTALLDLEDAQTQIAPSFTKSANAVQKSIDKASQFGQLTIQDVGEAINLKNIANQLSEGDAAIEKETNRLEKTKERLQTELDGIINLGKGPGDADKVKDILKLDTQELDAAFNLKDIKSRVNEYGNILLNINNTEKQRSNALKELIAINPAFANTLSLNKSRLEQNKTAIEDNVRSLNVLIQQREFDKRTTEINNQFLKEQEKQREKNIQAEEKEFDALVNLSMAYDKIGNSTDKIIVKSFEFTKALKKQQDITAAINKGLNNIYGLGTAEENDPVKRIDDLSKKIKQAKDNFESTIRNGLQEPFEDFFGTLIETGKFSLESFEGLFKNMLKNIAAQIVSAGIAKLISTILFPPGAAAGALAGAAAGNKSTGGVIGALISLFGGRRSAMNNVNFGGVGGGPLQMAGSVNLQLRGSDLVASINRTNSTINRIG